MTGITVLGIVGVRGRSVDRALAQVAAENSADGLTVTVFDGLSDLPRYSDNAESRQTPDAVSVLRTAATDADAVLVVTHYHDHVPTMVHNAIDWLTLGWNGRALRDKPIAVMGRAGGCFSGVWSHGQTANAHGVVGAHVVEPITVASLREAIQKLAGEVNIGSARFSVRRVRHQSCPR